MSNSPSLIANAKRRIEQWTLGAVLDKKVRRAQKDPSSGVPLAGKRVLITGASSGIGERAAYQFGQLGAELILVARRADELEAVAQKIRAAGGSAEAIPCDLRDYDALDALVADVTARVGGVDVLVNNAGHSIRRRAEESLERWHDFERTIQLNYLAAMRLTRGFLPGMLERRDGHIVNVATWAAFHEAAPLFAPYAAAKSALAVATRTIGAELVRKGVHTTTLYFPIVRTPMIAPTQEYDDMAALSSAEAAAWIVLAARARPIRIVPRVSAFLGLADRISPTLSNRLILGSIRASQAR